MSMLLPAIALASLCNLTPAEETWITEVRGAWASASRTALKIQNPVPARVVFFNETCVWDGDAAGVPHDGSIRLPDGRAIPPQLITFAATYGQPPKPFLVMAMPEIWRKAPKHANEKGLDGLIRSVFVHEMTHTQQSRTLGARIDALVVQNEDLEVEMDDDIVQKRFGDDPAFRAAYEKERDLLFRAALEKDRSVAREAVAAMKDRHARFLTGLNAVYGELEDIFLNMEGVANWAAYKAAEEDLNLIRRGGRVWSQDEGLAAFLVLDALLPGWQSRVFAEKPPSLMQLLEEASRVESCHDPSEVP